LRAPARLLRPIQERDVGHRVFNAVVVVFWLSTMSWLVIAKVLPALAIGDPPNYRSVYNADPNEPPPPVCWVMHWNDQPIGWAKSDVWRAFSGVTEVRSFVCFHRIPLDELAPAWLRPMLHRAVQSTGDLALIATSRLEIDPLGRLSRIYSKMRALNHRDAEIVISGHVQGTKLTGLVQSGGLRQPFERYLPPDALMGDELSPQARMPGLRIGQEWTVPVYSPLRFTDSRNPIDVLHATVEGKELVVRDDDSILALVVVYRSDSGSILGGAQAPRGKLWVADDGTVLKQTAYIFGSELTFVRASDKRAAEILQEAKPLVRAEKWRNGAYPPFTAAEDHDRTSLPQPSESQSRD
jgi:hypothetical protein